MTKYICPFCLNRAFGIKYDKRCKPFGACGLCKHKVFYQNTLAISATLAWCQTLEKLDAGQIRNLLMAGSTRLNQIRQENPQMETWAKTDDAMVMEVAAKE